MNRILNEFLPIGMDEGKIKTHTTSLDFGYNRGYIFKHKINAHDYRKKKKNSFTINGLINLLILSYNCKVVVSTALCDYNSSFITVITCNYYSFSEKFHAFIKNWKTLFHFIIFQYKQLLFTNKNEFKLLETSQSEFVKNVLKKIPLLNSIKIPDTFFLNRMAFCILW